MIALELGILGRRGSRVLEGGWWTDRFDRPTPPRLRWLLIRKQAGDREAAWAMHDKIADDIWGGTVDLYQMGLDGREPRVLAELRALVQETEPALWRLITQDDPLITK